ncbi:MAG: TIGR04283 family arsenosugar biosynthesis glycosyltransferase [Owenweeksia sp.]
MQHSFSIIIPTFNEEHFIGPLLDRLIRESEGYDVEIIVSDGGSTDLTSFEVQRRGVRFVESVSKGRGSQLNFGALLSQKEILYFLHADTFPPEGFLSDLCGKLDEGYGAGCYRLSFDQDHWFLKANAWLTRFDVNYFRFGDQSLFIRRSIFEEIGGYRNDHFMLEDQEIIPRIKKAASFVIIPRATVTSARKYMENGPVRLQWVFFIVWLNYKLGKSQAELLRLYKGKITDTKLEAEDATIVRPITPDLHQEPNSRESENPPGQRLGASPGR